MSEPRFWKLVLDQDALKDFLIEKGVLLDAETCNKRGLLCVNPNCLQPNKGFANSFRKRKMSEAKKDKLHAEGQEVDKLFHLRYKACNTARSPRSTGDSSLVLPLK